MLDLMLTSTKKLMKEYHNYPTDFVLKQKLCHQAHPYVSDVSENYTLIIASNNMDAFEYDRFYTMKNLSHSF